MQVGKWISTGLLLAAMASPIAAQNNRDAFQDVAGGHWAYQALDQAQRSGVVTGYPEGTFRGKRLLTRYEVAVAVQRAAENLLRSQAEAVAKGQEPPRESALRKLSLTGATVSPDFPRLITEFTPELRLLGADPDVLRRQVEQRAPADPAAPKPAVQPSREYEMGAKLAREEYEKGETVLYAGGLAPALTIDDQLGIPLHFAYGCLATPGQLELTRGHNDEVYRLIVARGLPANSRKRWLSDIRDPKGIWADPDRPRTAVKSGVPEVTSRDGVVTVRLKAAQDEQPPRLEVSEKGGKPFQQDLYWLDRKAPVMTVLWGSSGSHLLFIRYHEANDYGKGEVFQVIDTAFGRSLNRVYVLALPMRTSGDDPEKG